MANNKKYYYLKLKDNFYDSEQMIILQNMQDGYLYSDILMKLYLRSLKTDGKLMFNNLIPYTPNILAQVVRHQVGTVEKALKIFQQLGLIEILENGAIFMLDIQNFIGKSSTEADRIREYRQEIKQEQIECTNVQQLYDENTPEIEIEREKEIEKKKKKENITYFQTLVSQNDYKYIKENNNIYNTIIEWLEYKQQRKEKYAEKGLEKLLTQIENNIEKYDEEKMINVINESMANNWKGIIFEKLKKTQANQENINKPYWEEQKLTISETTDQEQQELKELLNRFN